MTCTVKGAKGAKLRTDLAFGKAKARHTGSGAVTANIRVDTCYRGREVGEGDERQDLGAAKARAGRPVRITLG